MKVSDFDYTLPAELIADKPAEPRDASRLMVIDRRSGSITHRNFFDICEYLDSNDFLVFNDTKVLPMRLIGNKSTGGKVEVLILRFSNRNVLFISKSGLKPGQKIVFKNGLKIEIKDFGYEGETMGTTNMDNDVFVSYLYKYGYTPLPHYIHLHSGLYEPNIRQMYQAIFAKIPGSAAAPTASLHFTKQLMDKLNIQGVDMEYVTLHVGLGTFAPIREQKVEEHKMHREYYSISQESKHKIQGSINSGKRIVASGTTVARTLESWKGSDKSSGETEIFIYPGYKWKVVDRLITNFHLPKSTLLMMVSSFAGHELIMKAYAEAIRQKYRFYSFGDAMLVI